MLLGYQRMLLLVRVMLGGLVVLLLLLLMQPGRISLRILMLMGEYVLSLRLEHDGGDSSEIAGGGAVTLASTQRDDCENPRRPIEEEREQY